MNGLCILYFIHYYNWFDNNFWGISCWYLKGISSVQSLSQVQLFVTPWTAAWQASLSITNYQTSQTLVHRVSDVILCRLLLPSSMFPSIRVLSNESVLPIRWPNYGSFSFNISFSSVCSGLISFRIERFDILAVQGTVKSLLQHHSSKSSVLQCSILMVQHSYLYMTTGNTIALTRWPFADKVMSLLFNMLSRLVIAFLPRARLF